MGKETGIQWTTHSWNGWHGCAKISPACDGCYAERDAKRFSPGRNLWGVDADRKTFGDKHWDEPLAWDRAAAKAGKRARVFAFSMADVFDKNAPAGARERFWELIAKTPNLDWLLLTKRVGNVSSMVPKAWMENGFPSNVWMGISVVNQDEANRDIVKLLRLPAVVRFLSIEPMLGPIDLVAASAFWSDGESIINQVEAFDSLGGDPTIDWVICGGESGPKARPMHPAWAESLRDQCAAAGVPFFFKQWGEWGPGFNEQDFTHGDEEKRAHAWVDGETAEWGRCWPIDDDGVWSNWTGAPRSQADNAEELHQSIAVMGWFGKQFSGRMLGGVEHSAFPHVVH